MKIVTIDLPVNGLIPQKEPVFTTLIDGNTLATIPQPMAILAYEDELYSNDFTIRISSEDHPDSMEFEYIDFIIYCCCGNQEHEWLMTPGLKTILAILTTTKFYMSIHPNKTFHQLIFQNLNPNYNAEMRDIAPYSPAFFIPIATNPNYQWVIIVSNKEIKGCIEYTTTGVKYGAFHLPTTNFLNNPLTIAKYLCLEIDSFNYLTLK